MAMQSKVLFLVFIVDHLHGRADIDLTVSVQHANGIIQPDFVEMDDMLEIPAYDQIGAADGGRRHMTGVIGPLSPTIPAET